MTIRLLDFWPIFSCRRLKYGVRNIVHLFQSLQQFTLFFIIQITLFCIYTVRPTVNIIAMIKLKSVTSKETIHMTVYSLSINRGGKNSGLYK